MQAQGLLFEFSDGGPMSKTNLSLFLSLAAIFLVHSGVLPAWSSDRVYRWIDENGVVVFSNTPPPEGTKAYNSDDPEFRRMMEQKAAQNARKSEDHQRHDPQGATLPVTSPSDPKQQQHWQKRENERKVCENFYENTLRIRKKDAQHLCARESLAAPISDPRFQECNQDIASLSDNNLNQLICYSVLSERADPLNESMKSCLTKTLLAVDPFFVFYEATSQSGWNSRLSKVVRDCRDISEQQRNGRHERTSPVIIERSYHFHSHNSVPTKEKTEDRLGGLSGVWFNSVQNKFFAVTDSQRTAYYFPFTWDLTSQYSRPQLMDAVKISNPKSKFPTDRFDLEDIIQLPNGNFIVTSEVDEDRDTSGTSSEPGGVVGFFSRIWRENKEKDKNRYLYITPIMEIGANGRLIKEIPIAEDLYPAEERFETTFDCTPMPSPPNSWTRPQQSRPPGPHGRGGSFFAPTAEVDPKDQPEDESPAPEPAPVERKTCTSVSYRKTKGFEHNQGIESLSYLQQTNEIFYATESPITQDKNSDTPFVRIYRQRLGQDLATQKYEKYPMTLQFGNGISAVLALDTQKVLVMERGFDSGRRETHIKIFLVDWTKKDSRGYLQKTLIEEMNNLKSQMPAGFQQFDNLEGMSLLSNTSTTLRLMLVSDNNMSSSQVTQFVILNIPKGMISN